MKAIDKAINRLMKEEVLYVYKGQVTDSDVQEIATKTGCALTDDYVTFVKRCGFALWEGHAINGVFDLDDEELDGYDFSAVSVTAEARKRHRKKPYPRRDDSIVVEEDGMGGYFLLVSATVNTDERVLWVNYDDEWVVTEHWPTFTDFLVYQLDAR
jgi:hypothetical protein